MPLSGRAVRNEGFALVPRRIGGRYAMLSRQDGENVPLMTTDELLRWDEAAMVYRPHEPWDLVQLGNCGSPILTEAGWLVLSTASALCAAIALATLRSRAARALQAS